MFLSFQALVEWFPDRKAIATGLTIAGFGSGSLLAAPVFAKLTQYFSTLPQYLGPRNAVTTVTQDGKLFADVGGQLKEVVIATSADIAKLAYKLSEGVYVVGSGSTGAVQAMAVMGVSYFTIMAASAFALRRPAKGYLPPGWVQPPSSAASVSSSQNVHVDVVMQTPQFRQLGLMFFCVACGGMVRALELCKVVFVNAGARA